MATKRNQDPDKSDKRQQAEPQPIGELILPPSLPVGEPVSDDQSPDMGLLQTCCAQFRAHYEQFVKATLSLLLYALEAGKYALLIKELSEHGNFRTYCETEFPAITFRRIEQFMILAESREELLELLRAENAQRAALLTDDQLLASTSIRKAQRLLSGPTEDDTSKKKSKKRTKCTPKNEVVSTSDDALTPQFIVDAALTLLRQFDLDPCASERRPSHIPAKSHWTAAQNSLAITSHWEGRALVHAPLTAIAAWIEKAKHEFEHQRLSEALLLVPAQTDAPWFPTLAAHPRAFFRERLAFANSDGGDPISAHEPYMVVFLGPAERTQAFAAVFSRWADAFLPVTATPETPRIEPQPD